jgi:uncharacterized membrane-anchored protein
MTLVVRIWLVTAALVAALVGLVTHENQARAAGQEVLLTMDAVDPRDILSGHYVALQLTQALLAQQPCPHGTAGPPTKGWVALTKQAQVYRVSGFAKTRQEAAALGVIQVQGQVNCFAAPGGSDQLGRIDLQIGIRRFHIDQASAEAMDKALRGRSRGASDAFAVVSVSDDGKARLKGVIIDGHRSDLTWN